MSQARNEGGEVAAADADERTADFWKRHGGPCEKAPQHGESDGGTRGWTEIYAADGHRLRCEWSTIGSETHRKFSEIAADPS